MLCTSGFMDDVTFGRNGRDAETWRLQRAATAMRGVAIPGWSLVSMNVLNALNRQLQRCNADNLRQSKTIKRINTSMYIYDD